MIEIRRRALSDRIGEEIAVSDWLEVTQARIEQFADATGDHQWIHSTGARGSRIAVQDDDRARLPDPVAAQPADPRRDAVRRAAAGDQLRPQPRAVRLAGPGRLAHPRAGIAPARSSDVAGEYSGDLERDHRARSAATSLLRRRVDRPLLSRGSPKSAGRHDLHRSILEGDLRLVALRYNRRASLSRLSSWVSHAYHRIVRFCHARSRFAVIVLADVACPRDRERRGRAGGGRSAAAVTASAAPCPGRSSAVAGRPIVAVRGAARTVSPRVIGIAPYRPYYYGYRPGLPSASTPGLATLTRIRYAYGYPYRYRLPVSAITHRHIHTAATGTRCRQPAT